MSYKLDSRTWKIVRAISESLSISEISRKTSIPKATVWRKINEMFSKTRIRFVVSSKALRLKPLVVIFDKEPSQLPTYTISFRKINISGKPAYMVIGLVPEKYVADYLLLFDIDPLLFIEGEEKTIWKPSLSEKYKVLSLINGELLVNYDILKKIKEKPSKKEPCKLDIYDLYIIKWKENYAFVSLTDIYLHALKEGIKASRQLLSYHYRKHVLPMWIGNAIGLYRPTIEYPFRVFIYECSDAEELAFKLSLIPYIYTIYYSKDTLFFVGQPSVKEIYELYSKVLKDHSPRPLICETYVDPSLVRFIIKYHKLWNKDWIKPKIAYKVETRQNR